MFEGKRENRIALAIVGLIITVALASIFWFIFFRDTKIAEATNNNVTICHKNNGNGWSKITVDPNAINGIGNGDHNVAGHQGGQDIIPPGFWDLNGRNWTTEGQAIYNNDCNTPVSPSPTPTATPTATPTPTEEPKEDVCPNLEGVQEELPEGYHFVWSGSEFPIQICIPNEEEPTPTPEVTPEPQNSSSVTTPTVTPSVTPGITPTKTPDPTPTPTNETKSPEPTLTPCSVPNICINK